MLDTNVVQGSIGSIHTESYSNSLDEALTNKVLSHCRLLLVEDNLINQKVASVYLAELGQNKVDIASTGYEALALLNQYHYSLIFLDIDLPDISGLEVCKAIKKSCLNQSTPIVIATAHREKQIREKCFSLGVDEVITKPLDFDSLTVNLPFWLNKNNQQINSIGSQ